MYGLFTNCFLCNGFFDKGMKVLYFFRNGQYCSRYIDIFKKVDVAKRMISALAEQNNVSHPQTNYHFLHFSMNERDLPS